jgi:hypothetical protein
MTELIFKKSNPEEGFHELGILSRGRRNNSTTQEWMAIQYLADKLKKR